MLKDIVVNLSVGVEQDVAAEYAISLARSFDAHLVGVAFAQEPVVPGTAFGSVAIDLTREYLAECKAAAAAASTRFNEMTRLSGVSSASHVETAIFPEVAPRFARLARRFDMAVIAQPEPSTSTNKGGIIEAALFDSGRPLLVVPYIQRNGFTAERALVCWDGSRNAARAIGDALPILAHMNSVEVVVITGERGKTVEVPGADIAHHLARHGLKVELRQIVAIDNDVASTILSHVADTGTSFIVMGGYGHSRLRELVLGGATRGILASMTAPTLLSH